MFDRCSGDTSGQIFSPICSLNAARPIACLGSNSPLCIIVVQVDLTMLSDMPVALPKTAPTYPPPPAPKNARPPPPDRFITCMTSLGCLVNWTTIDTDGLNSPDISSEDAGTGVCGGGCVCVCEREGGGS